MDASAIGFNAEVKSKSDINVGDAFKRALPQDFVKFGLIPEFIGRVPITVSLDLLDRDACRHFKRSQEFSDQTVYQTSGTGWGRTGI